MNYMRNQKIKGITLLLGIACVSLAFLVFRLLKSNSDLSNQLDDSMLFRKEFASWIKKSNLEQKGNLLKELENDSINYTILFSNLSQSMNRHDAYNDSVLLARINKNSIDNFTIDDLNDYKKLKSEFNRLLSKKEMSNELNTDDILEIKKSYEEKIDRLILEKEFLEKSSSKKGYLSFRSESGAEINYVGEIENNLAHGYGIAMFSSGFRYEGNWKEGKKEGYGVYYYKNNEKYEGDFLNGKREGKGTYYFSNGDKYIGDWKNDKRNGVGFIEKSKGTIAKNGTWENDKFVGK
jgi:hypothetical protein